MRGDGEGGNQEGRPQDSDVVGILKDGMGEGVHRQSQRQSERHPQRNSGSEQFSFILFIFQRSI